MLAFWRSALNNSTTTCSCQLFAILERPCLACSLPFACEDLAKWDGDEAIAHPGISPARERFDPFFDVLSCGGGRLEIMSRQFVNVIVTKIRGTGAFVFDVS